MIRKKDIVWAVISGLLLIPSFAPVDLYPFAWIALIPLLVSLKGKDKRAAFSLGMISGFVYFVGTVYWISHSMRVYGYLPVAATVAVMVVLCLYLALYVGSFSILFNIVKDRSQVPASVIVPVLWVSLEFLRTYALTGFPWSVLGYSQYRFLTMIQIADITGIYGVSFLVAATNGMLYDVVSYRLDKAGQPLTARWPVVLSISFTAILITAAALYGAVKLADKENNRKIRASVIQANIPQDQKWDRRFQEHVISQYKRLTVKASSDSPDIIIWPESALPFVFAYEQVLTEDILQFQKQSDSHLIVGSVTGKSGEEGRRRLANSAVLISPGGSVLSVYDKIHLVPFGEYVPLGQYFPFIKKMVVAVGDFVPGKEYVVMNTPFARIGNLICYEIVFPGFVREFVEKGADVLVTITNDAWFGRTSAPYQHFSMAVFRAVENRVPVIRSANTGISGFIDDRGRILNSSAIFTETSLTEEVMIGGSKSFYTRYGDMFAFLCILCSVLLLFNNIGLAPK